MRVDSHQHFWRLDRGDYGWLTPALAPIYRDYLPEHLAPLIARAGVGKTILVQAAPTVAETRYLLGLAREHAFIAGVVGWVDFEAPTLPRSSRSSRATPNCVGLRPMIQDIADPEWMLRERAGARIRSDDRSRAGVRRAGIAESLAGTARTRRALSGTRHGAGSRREAADRGGDMAAWKQRDRRAGARDAHRLQTLRPGHRGRQRGSCGAARSSVDHLLEIFGPARLMWGSDWPVCELVCSYEDWRGASDKLLAKLGDTNVN